MTPEELKVVLEKHKEWLGLQTQTGRMKMDEVKCYRTLVWAWDCPQCGKFNTRQYDPTELSIVGCTYCNCATYRLVKSENMDIMAQADSGIMVKIGDTIQGE